nr:NAD kinase [Canibacter zhoujuaniae]
MAVSPDNNRKMLVTSHTARPEAISATRETLAQLHAHGVVPVMLASDIADFANHVETTQIRKLHTEVELADIEAAIVLGGDGTILRAAETVRGSQVPIVGVNLGHVGFLAEMEHHNLAETVRRVLAREYTVEERATLDVAVHDGDDTVHKTFAVNEATVEKTSRMIEVAVGVDSRPLTAFGCDGVVVATATGSTAYGFSAGGPVMWPEVDAMLVVPLAAHALFNRPLVLGPNQVVEIRYQRRNKDSAALWCDGRRRIALAPGQRAVIKRSSEPLRLARLDTGVFTDRLVNKFKLPVEGWRGAAA